MAGLVCKHTAGAPEGERVWDVAFSPLGNALAVTGGFHAVALVDAAAPERQLDMLDEVHERTVRRIGWAPSGRALAAASFDGTVSVWALPDDGAPGGFALAHLLQGHENEVKAAAWSASGALLATCSRDKSVWIWNLDPDGGAPACVAVLQGHSQDVKTVVWHPSQDVLVSASYDNELRLWIDDDGDWFCCTVLAGHLSTVWDVAFSPDGSSLVSASSDGTLKIWTLSDVVAGKPAGSIITENSDYMCVATVSDYFTRDIYAVDWNKTTGLIAAAGGDNAIVVLAVDNAVASEVSTSLIASAPAAHDDDINAVAWHPRQPDLLASGADDGMIKVWQVPEP
ncbi:uncharacterized protein AMSG_02757 [Thecamonas trahens ATCC 50062]|uniref:Probable cytosolic iron-sulfur protein assembly protein CIAO1 homolog n=1 Tax=Thecamonas trahens ATCC 50062 TaxID=461836 RepID=A0A0L0D2D4_THETB|nr:hypothetical protein AMSG_02757 [Thecamonas trahens ATCC 50062]KNC46305.1 hypothetical protein AMSG_02757 [Thecamonas trahens ATCC 50062]|eukprot:XP_013760598.1 hypothetical protein AMSG_02757 [Thecamonas trahens ATCC 50062]